MSESATRADFWFGIALDKEKKAIIFASCGDDKRGVERRAQQQFPQGMPILCLNMVRDPISRLRLWLIEHDILGAENEHAVIGFRKMVLDLIEKKKQREAKP